MQTLLPIEAAPVAPPLPSSRRPKPPLEPRSPTLVFNAKEFKLVSLRECPLPLGSQIVDTPESVANYYRAHIRGSLMMRDGVENFVVIYVNTRRRVLGHSVVSTGTLDTLLVHPREVFRSAIVANSAAIVLCHNLCAQAHNCYVTPRVMCSA